MNGFLIEHGAAFRALVLPIGEKEGAIDAAGSRGFFRTFEAQRRGLWRGGSGVIYNDKYYHTITDRLYKS